MKKVNFNAVDGLTTPDEWLEKALAVPKEQKRNKTPFWQRTVIAAACTMIVASLSVMLFVFFNFRQPISITVSVPDHTAPSTVSEQDERSSEDGSYPPSDAASDTAASGTEETVIHNGIAATVYTSFLPQLSETSAPASAPSSQAPSHAGNTEEPAAETTSSSEAPTETASQSATAAATEAPTETATQSATAAATENASEQPKSTESPSQPATEPAEEYVDTLIRGFYIPPDMDVYCRITDLSGSVMYGDEDIYSQQHLCTVTERTKYQTFCAYSPKEHGILPQKGCYICIFYVDSGSVFLTEKVYLND